MGGISGMEEMGETGKSTRLLTYGYDKRGNLIQELEGDTLLHGYTYNAGNRLAHAWNHKGEEAFYTYNGLGQRVGRRTSIAGEEETETYLLDFTRPYHNLLGIEKGNSRKTFYWDGNVIAMEEENNTPALPEESMQTNGNIPTAGMHYYLLDELGSPLRVNGYAEGDKSAYLTYGYDEFGNDLYEDLEEAGIPNPYSRQGEEQPFGYTGYRYDNISHSYFAQAREYQPENGRFNAEDVIKGNGAFPETLNHYGYCLNNPVGYVDLDGRKAISAAKGVVGDSFNQINLEIAKKIIKLIEEINSIARKEECYKIMDEYVNGNTSINIDEAIEYIGQTESLMSYSEEYDRFDNEIVAWTSYWNDRLELDMDANYIKAMIMEESTMGTNPNKNGTRDVMQTLYEYDMGMWVLIKRDPNDYGYNVGYDPYEGIACGIPKEGYPFLQVLFEDGTYNKELVTPRMSIAAGTRYLAYRYMMNPNFLLAIEGYNGGGNPNYLEDVIAIYNEYGGNCDGLN